MNKVITNKNCSECNANIRITEEDIIPVEGIIDTDRDEKHLTFICRCPYCGEICELSDDEKNLISIETIKSLMTKYACCSEYIKQLWILEKEKSEIIKNLANVYEREVSLHGKINFAMSNVSKDHLYHHWPLTDEIVKSEEQKRKKLSISDVNPILETSIKKAVD